jgi:hypothetical protein
VEHAALTSIGRQRQLDEPKRKAQSETPAGFAPAEAEPGGTRKRGRVLLDLGLDESALQTDALEEKTGSSVRRRRRDLSVLESSFEGGLTPRTKQEDEATIRVGARYQATVPPLQRRRAEPDKDTRARLGTLAWNPTAITEAGLARYLEKAASIRNPAVFPADAACNLLHRHAYAMQPAIGALRGAEGLDSVAFDAWPTEDVTTFEEGVARFGKNFHRVAKELGGKYPVGTLVLFYYARWKKTSGFRVWQSLREKQEDENIAECRVCGKGERDADADDGDEEPVHREDSVEKKELLRCDACPAVYHAECCLAMYASSAACGPHPLCCVQEASLICVPPSVLQPSAIRIHSMAMQCLRDSTPLGKEIGPVQGAEAIRW